MQREGWEMGMYFCCDSFSLSRPPTPPNKKTKTRKEHGRTLGVKGFSLIVKGWMFIPSMAFWVVEWDGSGVPSHVGCESFNLGDFQHASNCRKLRLSHRTQTKQKQKSFIPPKVKSVEVFWYDFLKQWQLNISFYVHPTWGKWSHLSNVFFQMGWFNCKTSYVNLEVIGLTGVFFNASIFPPFHRRIPLLQGQGLQAATDSVGY